MKKDPNQRQQELKKESEKLSKKVLKGLGLGLISSFGMALGTSVIGGGVLPGSPIPDVSQDTEFIKEVEKL